jgi:hypothetical protein
MVKHVGDILDEDGERLGLCHVVEVPLVQVYAIVYYVGYLSVFLLAAMCFVPKFGPAHAGEGLARWAAHEDIDLAVGWACDSESAKDGKWLFQNISGLRMRG